MPVGIIHRRKLTREHLPIVKKDPVVKGQEGLLVGRGLHLTALVVLELLAVVVVLVVVILLLRVNNRVDLIPQTPHLLNYKLVANVP